ncbi:restriction endonuclease subunit S [Prevotella communis]|uniref:restriction endonuclease subunit S n=1 Tax=Prevotella communis TaxID=2913614 RepID=UPI001EDA13F8|nr:restriction endonuclease subunit S [Prevotella communis]UKK60599.1 restriction endonuclease subunit S [Prevotella communis]
MNAQQLKNAILQEAIEGRLVPQDPNDEPASALLERIRKEKEELVKVGKLKKKDLEVKPISEDEIPFEIPEGWEWVRWGTLSESIQYGYNAPAKARGRIPMVRISDIQDGKIVWDTVPYCDINENDIDSYLLKQNDILFARTGGTVGKSYLVKEMPKEAIYAGYLIRTRYSNSLCPQYLKFFMESALYWLQLKDGTIATAQPNCNGKTLSQMILPLPPLAEQHRIVAKIEELLPKVEEYGKAQDTLNKLNAELPERLKKSILQEAISGRLVPQDPNDEPASVLLAKIRKEKEELVKAGKLKKKDLIETPISEDEIPFEIPESWEWVRLPYISTNSLGKTLNGGKTIGKTKKYLCSINVYWNKIDWKKIKETPFDESDCQKYRLTKGDLLVCEGGDYGRSAVWDKDDEMYYQNALHRIRFFQDLNPYFYMYCMETFKNMLLLEEVAKGMTIKHLTQDALYSLLFPLPPLTEQYRIVEKLEQLLSEVDKLEK